ncbi:MAG: arylsulfatase [Pseudomonadota bacterium]
MTKRQSLFLGACAALLTSCESPPAPIVEAEATLPETTLEKDQPNFLIVVADDLGWSDVGAFGGEINTPTLNALAAGGMMMTQYYVAPTCSPTRSMLMTGMDNHPAGVGSMAGIIAPNQVGNRNYGAQLHDDVVTIAEALKADGYTTMMSGKWHLAVDQSQTPDKRGFDRSFTMPEGGASHFADKKPIHPGDLPEYLEDGVSVELPADFYSSIGYTDKLVEYLDAAGADQPFLAYLAYTAPHDPLQVPEEWRDRYDGTYDVGPLAIKAGRLERQEELGLVPEDIAQWQVPNFPPSIPLHQRPWDERSDAQRTRAADTMEIYAAMVELMDEQLARVIQKLDDMGELDNTYVIFFSDNGASAVAPLIYPNNSVEWMAENWPTTYTDIATEDAFTVMGREWANVSNTPWRLNKGQIAEGGTRSPMIVHGPGIEAGVRSTGISHVQDIAPTLMELAGIEIENNPLYDGKLLPQGVSLASVWLENADSPRTSYGAELFGNGAYREDDWKITLITPPQGSGKWELFNLAVDPGETNNLAASEPDRLTQMIAAYNAYEEANGVIHPDVPPRIRLRQLYTEPCDATCEQAFADFEAAQRARMQKPTP